MKKQTQTYLIWFIFIALILGGLGYLIATSQESKEGQYDSLAQCISESEATFYGAFWCPHCREQKALFGQSSEKLPYVECSTPDGNGQNQTCNEAGIESYPTWEFADGSRETGVIPREELAQLTSCEAALRRDVNGESATSTEDVEAATSSESATGTGTSSTEAETSNEENTETLSPEASSTIRINTNE